MICYYANCTGGPRTHDRYPSLSRHRLCSCVGRGWVGVVAPAVRLAVAPIMPCPRAAARDRGGLRPGRFE